MTSDAAGNLILDKIFLSVYIASCQRDVFKEALKMTDNVKNFNSAADALKGASKAASYKKGEAQVFSMASALLKRGIDITKISEQNEK